MTNEVNSVQAGSGYLQESLGANRVVISTNDGETIWDISEGMKFEEVKDSQVASNLFKTIDTDGNGEISGSEIKEYALLREKKEDLERYNYVRNDKEFEKYNKKFKTMENVGMCTPASLIGLGLGVGVFKGIQGSAKHKLIGGLIAGAAGFLCSLMFTAIPGGIAGDALAMEVLEKPEEKDYSKEFEEQYVKPEEPRDLEYYVSPEELQ